MIKGLSLVLMTTVLWGAIAVIFDRVAKKKVNIHAFYGCSLLFGTLCSLFFIHWGVLFQGQTDRLAQLVLLISISGILNTIAMLLMIMAMRKGHSSLVWTVTQSAIVVQFIYSTIIWSESISLSQVLGLSAIFLNFILVSAGNNGPSAKSSKGLSGQQLIIVLTSFILIGISQVMFITPSHWSQWQDATGLRVPLLYIVPGIFMAWMTFRSGQNISKAGMWLGLLLALFGVAGMLMLSASLDALAPLKISKIAYPIATAGSIVLFALYSFTYLKEPFGLKKWAGIVLGIAGIVLISI